MKQFPYLGSLMISEGRTEQKFKMEEQKKIQKKTEDQLKTHLTETKERYVSENCSLKLFCLERRVMLQPVDCSEKKGRLKLQAFEL